MTQSLSLNSPRHTLYADGDGGYFVPMSLLIRAAAIDDWPVLVEFNCRLAAETEGKQLDRAHVEPGVKAVLADPRKGRYFVACIDGRVVGQLLHTFEWSDWRNGDIWWLQSVYVHPDYRRAGVFRALFDHLRSEAKSDPGVVGLRLYVESHNDRAQKTYNQLGLTDAEYIVMEQMLKQRI